jgi:hypothetical protein
MAENQRQTLANLVSRLAVGTANQEAAAGSCKPAAQSS